MIKYLHSVTIKICICIIKSKSECSTKKKVTAKFFFLKLTIFIATNALCNILQVTRSPNTVKLLTESHKESLGVAHFTAARGDAGIHLAPKGCSFKFQSKGVSAPFIKKTSAIARLQKHCASQNKMDLP